MKSSQNSMGLVSAFTHSKVSAKYFLIWLAVLIILAAVLFLYLSYFKHCLIDDAFITMQYASNLCHHFHWGFFPDWTTNTATSPLNVILTAIAGFFVSDMLEAVICLAVIESLLLCVLLLLISKKLFGGYYFGIVSFLAIMTNPLLMSTIGLESLLYTLLTVVCIYLFLVRRWYMLAVFLALLTLTRPDGFLLFVAMFLFVRSEDSKRDGSILRVSGEVKLPFRLFSKKRITLFLIYLLCLAPWYLFSWIRLGSVLPDTFFIKIAQSSWDKWWFANGILLYLKAFPLETFFSFFLVALIPLFFIVGDRRIGKAIIVLFIFVIVYFVGYSAL